MSHSDLLDSSLFPAKLSNLVGIFHQIPFSRTRQLARREESDGYKRHPAASLS